MRRLNSKQEQESQRLALVDNLVDKASPCHIAGEGKDAEQISAAASSDEKCAQCNKCVLRDANGTILNATDKSGKRSKVPHLICLECNALISRVNRLTKADPSLSTGFNGLNKEDKVDWLARNSNTFGDALVKELQVCCSMVTENTAFGGFKGTGMWLDEEDLRDKYKNKINQAESIMENSRSFMHPHRKVTVYEDVDFTTEAEI